MAGEKPEQAGRTVRRRDVAERQRMFLEVFRSGDVEAGLEAARITEWTLWRWKRDDEAFGEAFKEAKEAKGPSAGVRAHFTGRKGVFLEALEGTGVMAAALRAAEATMPELRSWRRDDAAFRAAVVEVKGRIRARADEELELRIAAGERVKAAGRKRVFLKKVRSVGTTTGGCEAAGVTLKVLNAWLREDKSFAEGFEEAKQRFRDHIEEKIVHRIEEGKNGGLLQFKAQAELPEKYGKGRKQAPAEGQPGLTWAEIEQAARAPHDADES